MYYYNNFIKKRDERMVKEHGAVSIKHKIMFNFL